MDNQGKWNFTDDEWRYNAIDSEATSSEKQILAKTEWVRTAARWGSFVAVVYIICNSSVLDTLYRIAINSVFR